MENFCIETTRLELRPIHANMAKEFNELVLDTFDTLHPWLNFAHHPLSVEETTAAFQTMYDQFLNDNRFFLAIYLKSEQKYIGTLRCDDKNPPIMVNDVRPWDIGYWLHKNYVGCGYVNEGVKGLMKYLQEEKQVTIFSIFMQYNNEKSAKVAERLNFKLKSIEEMPYHRADWPEKILSKIFILEL